MSTLMTVCASRIAPGRGRTRRTLARWQGMARHRCEAREVKDYGGLQTLSASYRREAWLLKIIQVDVSFRGLAYSRDYQRQDYIGFLILRMSWQFLNHTNPEASPNIFKASPCQRIQLCKSTCIGSHHSRGRFASTVVFLAMRLDPLQIDTGLCGF